MLKLLMIRKEQVPVLVANVILLVVFTVIYLARANYEFLLYVGIIIALLAVLIMTNDKVHYPNLLLWGLTIWSFMHMAGGGLYIGGEKLYELMIFNIVGEPFLILKYDQVVHVFGFGIATLAMFYVLKPILKKDLQGITALSIIVIMAGLGVGALNEIIEFAVSIAVPESGVGGYHNTMLDLVADLIGGFLALAYILKKERKDLIKK